MIDSEQAGGLPRQPFAEPVRLADIPQLGVEAFRQRVIDRVRAGRRISALFGHADAGSPRVRLYAVLADDAASALEFVATDVGDSYAALTPECAQAHWFEREIAEQWGVRPVGHPWLKPIRFHHSYRPGKDAWQRSPSDPLPCSVTDFFRMEGDEVHEVGVGPIHAGVIEPGHFRFQCRGEHVYHLEISLGFQHRGIERALLGGPHKRTMHQMEAVAGDTSIGHATAYCRILESLAGAHPSLRAQALRGIALELERLANHTGDMGALAGDVGYLPTLSFCGRLRGDFLNSTAMLCGSRFGRTMVRPGGVGWDVDEKRTEQLRARVEPALADVAGALSILWEAFTVQARFEDIGRVSREVCEELGLVGVAARACGVVRDVRHDFPWGIFRFAFIPVSTWATGDVFARAYVRGLEIERSGQFILQQLATLPAGAVQVPVGRLAPDSLAVSLVEGWRGEICHVALTDGDGRFVRYKIVDPSFHNWVGLMMALRDQQISDFPLCNKSFNLSYCGHDLQSRNRMFDIIAERIRQGYRTMSYPDADPPALPDRFRGLPVLDSSKCGEGCRACAEACPTDAISIDSAGMRLDLGRCLFCTDCQTNCPEGALRFTPEYRLATRRREDLIVRPDQPYTLAEPLEPRMRRLFGRSLKLRQVSAGGSNACEADCNVLSTLVFDMGRFGIQFVASPRHADGLLITGPVSDNMRRALEICYESVPTPKVVIAVGVCSISGGPFAGQPEQHNGADSIVPVDLYIPGFPPHPLTILDGLLRLMGRLEGAASERSRVPLVARAGVAQARG